MEKALAVVTAHLRDALLRDGRSFTEISRLSGVPQPTIWRLSSRKEGRSRRTNSFIKLCKFYGIAEQADEVAIATSESELRDALLSVWDGSKEHAQALIGVIRSLRALRPRRYDSQKQKGAL